MFAFLTLKCKKNNWQNFIRFGKKCYMCFLKEIEILKIVGHRTYVNDCDFFIYKLSLLYGSGCAVVYSPNYLGYFLIALASCMHQQGNVY